MKADLLKRLSAEAQKYATAGPPHIRDLLLEAGVEIETLRRDYAILLERWKEATQAPPTKHKPSKTAKKTANR